MPQPLTYFKETPSQTAGPYVHIGLAPGAAGFKLFDQELGQDIAGPNAQGERIAVTGIVLDGTGAPVKDVMLEIWQANAAGIYPHTEDPNAAKVEDGFRGWGRVISDFETGEYRFETIKPGAVPGRSGTIMAPHLNIWIAARGINIGLNTRMYFADETGANASDPILNSIEQVHRRATLIAARNDTGSMPEYRFEIRLQGVDETVFFDI